jgi:hypothetical protein
MADLPVAEWTDCRRDGFADEVYLVSMAEDGAEPEVYLVSMAEDRAEPAGQRDDCHFPAV